jgi:hypothetical protein
MLDEKETNHYEEAFRHVTQSFERIKNKFIFDYEALELDPNVMKLSLKRILLRKL